MRIQASYVRPFQIVLDLSLVASAKLHAAQPANYQREEVSVFLDEVTADIPIRVRSSFVPAAKIPPKVVKDRVWRLHTDGFYLNDLGKPVVRWPNDLCGTLSIDTFDIVHDFYTPEELAAAADEIMGIVATGCG